MRYQSDLERLMTLDGEAIVRVCTSPEAVVDLIAEAVDECLEFDELADEHLSSGNDEQAAYCRQEAAAWRATVSLLRVIADDPDARRTVSGAA
ncbi:hypothetical protein GIY30_03240 [Gordonia sp. HNM0687]|uniref:TY-Chap C-terminal domain-containing protein n=1 Tax=Gordonia mangrovi TaxID=2665643 RepID=A0A6L7GKC6_9ACTN|nr:hypothetical protein [Gordonia mangrovi]MXP20370.1 hypothetical protein [Gordonia mangrovi]UVF79031.1 hypothetical protein NWF22_04010 [Gordonia mangrovi]